MMLSLSRGEAHTVKYRLLNFSRRFQTVDKPIIILNPSSFSARRPKTNSNPFFPAACTSGKTLCAERVYFCMPQAYKNARFEANPLRRQSHFDFVDDLKPPAEHQQAVFFIIK